jgi:hemerythrin-like domain-containing protein
MAVQIGARPDSGFDDPLGMLQDCHRRIEKFLGILCLVAERAETGALSDEEKNAVGAALRYFQEGGRRHNQDEEESLFPRLMDAAANDPDILHRLESEHQDGEELHATVAQLFSAWIARGVLASGDRPLLLSATQRLKGLYADHIRVEEEIVFPYAARVLDRDRIREIGRELQARRGVGPS